MFLFTLPLAPFLLLLLYFIVRPEPVTIPIKNRHVFITSGAHGVDVAIFAADVREYDAVEGAVVGSGPIDVLVVNQGIFVPQALEKQGLDEIKLMIDVKLMGSFNVIKAVLPLMKYRKDGAPAAIALVSSRVGQVGIYGYTAYSATKFGLREALQQGLISDNLRVSLISWSSA
ncbi:hypothetical protein Godav_009758, partial [Gossypium davidsonii]|nr:hypothetical protein [Gossypium davidsonii]